MKQLFWAEQAEADVVAIIEQANTADPNEGMRLLDLILEAPKLLLDFPALGMVIRVAGHRKWRVKDTPFLLLYRANGDSIQISRVVHGASDWANLS